MKSKRVSYKTVTLRLDSRVYERLKEYSASEKRSLANGIETLAMSHLEECQFVDEAEMAEIRADRELLKRLRAGYRDLDRRRGRYVD